MFVRRKLNKSRTIRVQVLDKRNGCISKKTINQLGYNKFLSIENDVKVSIDETKIEFLISVTHSQSQE